MTSAAPSGAQVSHRHRSGELSVPAHLDGIVTAVLGLDDRPQAGAMFRIAAPHPRADSSAPHAQAASLAPGTGWDPCTGLGVPNGVQLLDVLMTAPRMED